MNPRERNQSNRGPKNYLILQFEIAMSYKLICELFEFVKLDGKGRRRVILALILVNLSLIPIALVAAIFGKRSYGLLEDTVLFHGVICGLSICFIRLHFAFLSSRSKESYRKRVLLAFGELFSLWPLAVCITMVALKLLGKA